MFQFKKNYISLLLISFLFSACATKEYANNSRIAVVSKTEIEMVKKTEVSNISGLDKINNEKKEIILLTSFEKIKLKLFQRMMKNYSEKESISYFSASLILKLFSKLPMAVSQLST